MYSVAAVHQWDAGDAPERDPVRAWALPEFLLHLFNLGRYFVGSRVKTASVRTFGVGPDLWHDGQVPPYREVDVHEHGVNDRASEPFDCPEKGQQSSLSHRNRLPVSPTPVVEKYFHVGFRFGSFNSGRPHFFQFARTFSLIASG